MQLESDVRPVVVSITQSVKEFYKNPEYENIRKYLPLRELVQYAGDCDSISTLIETFEEDNKENLLFSPEKGFPEANHDTCFGEACGWGELFTKEIQQQLDAVKIKFLRDVHSVCLVSGNRLVLGVEGSKLPPT